MTANIDLQTVEGFGLEWSVYDQSHLSPTEHRELFEKYFAIFPWERLPPDAVGFDLGCGSGRWAKLVGPKVGTLHCIDASDKALAVARTNLASLSNCRLHAASVDHMPLSDDSMDFGYSLGVLHHVPDTEGGIRSCVNKLKPGAPFLLYLYYALDNRPWWFRAIWTLTHCLRLLICRLPMGVKVWATALIAVAVYYPLARLTRFLAWLGCNVEGLPLSYYRNKSYYTMRTDALDRFGTRLEHRYSADQIRTMMTKAGLEAIHFSPAPPYWCAIGFKKLAPV